ncbi:hypothetical protein K402DRAFT_59261 [Aulographum hederae CBS 113979]|uniref:Uncharacterized protein n=1 Tax=Aulographum hederae CBS 113979 TaxID=1176131 RepID=A0A6G1H1K1_9PEZI|nr:hypothetical protein K402DRAFT_59261 [Aulographum hederae CBS 113979]
MNSSSGVSNSKWSTASSTDPTIPTATPPQAEAAATPAQNRTTTPPPPANEEMGPARTIGQVQSRWATPQNLAAANEMALGIRSRLAAANYAVPAEVPAIVQPPGTPQPAAEEKKTAETAQHATTNEHDRAELEQPAATNEHNRVEAEQPVATNEHNRAEAEQPAATNEQNRTEPSTGPIKSRYATPRDLAKAARMTAGLREKYATPAKAANDRTEPASPAHGRQKKSPRDNKKANGSNKSTGSPNRGHQEKTDTSHVPGTNGSQHDAGFENWKQKVIRSNPAGTNPPATSSAAHHEEDTQPSAVLDCFEAQSIPIFEFEPPTGKPVVCLPGRL